MRGCALISRRARHFPSDDAATKLIWLALRNITEDWGRAANNWKSAMNQFAILYERPVHEIEHVRSFTSFTISVKVQ